MGGARSASAQNEDAGPPEPRYQVLDSPEQVREAVRAGLDAGRIGLRAIADATGSDRRGAVGAHLRGLALSLRPGTACYVRLDGDRGDGLLRGLRPLLETGGPLKVTHDGKDDVLLLAQRGLELAPLGFDTALAAYLLAEPTRLEELAAARLGIDPPPLTRMPDDGLQEAAAHLACGQADTLLRLCEELESALRERGQLDYLCDVELPLAPVLAHMELTGIALDTRVLNDLSQRLGAQLRALEAEIAEVAGREVNPNSGRQLNRLLFEELGLRGARKTSTGYSTDVYALEALAYQHPVVGKILAYRRLSKLKDTYADVLPSLVNPRTGRLHSTFSQVSATTGRITSSEPNLQNIPVRSEEGRKVRRAFVAGNSAQNRIIPEPTVLLSADYAQFELRVLAHVAGETRLREAFEHGEDVHALTAAELYGVAAREVTPEMRRAGKMTNYGAIYGMTGYRLARDTGLPRGEATEFVRRHAELFPAIRAHFEQTVREAEKSGYVETPMGRRRYLPDLRSSNRQRREAARRAAENMPNQGMAADIIKLAMISIHARLRERGLSARMLLQVHDELLFELPERELAETATLVLREMRDAVQLSVPLEVEAKYGPSWGEMQRLHV